MALTIPIQAVPSQIILCVLSNQNVQIAIYLKAGNLFVDINSNGVDMCVGCLALNGVPLDACNSWDGFQGNLYLIDTQGLEDPIYTGLGSRWLLVYLSAAEVIEYGFVPQIIVAEIVTPVLSMARMLQVTSTAPGNFTVAHGLGTLPTLIEIVPTSSGAIWGQTSFVDGLNVYLVASDAGVTANVMVYTQDIATDVVPLVSSATLTVSSPNYGPFTVAHGLGQVPALVEILPTSLGFLWMTAAPDATNLYLAASDEGVTASIALFASTVEGVAIEAPAYVTEATSPSPGTFRVLHNLPTVPSRIEILMLSSGSIVAQTPAFDGSYVYLDASDTGVIALISVYA
jgi:hypothetical protein